MAGPELIVDNTEDICFPEPELKIENAGGPVAVRFRCEKCGEVGQAFEGPQTYFVKLRGMAEEQFLTEQACDLARRSAAAEQQPAGEEATTEGSEPRRREEEVEKVVHWEESSDHAPGDLLRKIARDLPPSVVLYALYCSLGDEDRPFAREWAETFGPGWGMMSDDEKPRLQKMTGMLVAEMGNILAAEARVEQQTGSWATPSGKRLEILVDYVTEGLHEALSTNRDEIPVGHDAAQTLAMVAAGKVVTDSLHPRLVSELRSGFEDHFIERLFEDVPEDGPLTEDQLERLAFVAAMGASWWSFVVPLQKRVAADLRRCRRITDRPV